MNKPYDEPAFPVESHNEVYSGMTLRDYFAAKAMQTLLAGDFARYVTKPEWLVAHSYEFADAMLTFRSLASDTTEGAS